MNPDDILKIANYIAQECIKLKDKYVDKKDLEVDYIAIFSQSKNEYKALCKTAAMIGKVVDKTPTGDVFKLHKRITSIIGNPQLLKIRVPDTTRPQKGDVDFNSDYKNFKDKYYDNKRFKLIIREEFEMLELKDEKFDVLVYFSNTPLTKRLGIA